MSDKHLIRAFFDEATNTISYLVADPQTKRAGVIDPVLDYDPKSATVDTRSVRAILAAAKEAGFLVEWSLETHAHKTDGSDFDRLFGDGERFKIGNLEVEVIYTPGHTPACISYEIANAVFVGDTLFMPDYGTACADFPSGDAHKLYRSIQRLLDLPPETRLFMCHDYKAPGRDHYAWEATVAEQRQKNVHVRNGVKEDDFVAMRNARDATLSAPTLLLPSIEVNIRAGRVPPAEANGVRYLKIPVKFKADAETGL